LFSLIRIFLVNSKKFDNVFALWEFEKFLPRDRTYTILQIGVFTGDATDWLLKNRDITSIHDVDIWHDVEGVHREGHNAEVEEYYDSRKFDPNKVVKFKMTSNEFFVSEGPKFTYSFIYIDGDHSAVQTALDGLNAFNVLEEGGILAFDDFLWESSQGSFYEPKIGIRSFLRIVSSQSKIVHMGRQVWIIKDSTVSQNVVRKSHLVRVKNEFGYLTNLFKILVDKWLGKIGIRR
jgi:hypothetical protein